MKFNEELKTLFDECKANGLRCFYKKYEFTDEIMYGWISDGRTILYFEARSHNNFYQQSLSYVYVPSRSWGSAHMVYDSGKVRKDVDYNVVKKFMHKIFFHCGRRTMSEPCHYENVDEWIEHEKMFGDNLREY